MLRDASVSVQVVGSSNTVRAKIHLEAQYCPPGFKIEKAVKGMLPPLSNCLSVSSWDWKLNNGT